MTNDSLEKLPEPKEEPGPRCPDFAEIVRNADVDDSLFEQVSSCFSKRLEDFANYYCNDSTLGKDAFQEALITTWKNLGSYRGDSPIEPWLRRIVVSSCSRLRRGKKNDRSINTSFEAHEGAATFADKSHNQEISLVIAQGLDRLNAEIEKLEEPNRTLLLRHDVHEESVSSLSAEFNLSIDAVKSRLKRARSQVREALLAHGHG